MDTASGETKAKPRMSWASNRVLLPSASGCAPSLTTKMVEMEKEQPDVFCGYAVNA